MFIIYGRWRQYEGGQQFFFFKVMANIFFKKVKGGEWRGKQFWGGGAKNFHFFLGEWEFLSKQFRGGEKIKLKGDNNFFCTFLGLGQNVFF